MLQVQYETSSEEEEAESDVDEGGASQMSGGVVDLEDLGKVMNKLNTAKVMATD